MSQTIAEQALLQHSEFCPVSEVQVKTRTECRSCESGDLESVLNLGNLYLSNFAHSPDPQGWPRAPLELVRCVRCGLVQLGHTSPQEWLYRQCWRRCGMNGSTREELADVAAKAAEFAQLRGGDSVLDIGCNDGTLLRSYAVPGLHRVGFEPAANLCVEASAGTDRIIPDFFFSQELADRRFRAITSIFSLCGQDDPNRFVSEVARVLAGNGVWVIEMDYLPLTLARTAFDAICHEYLAYYSLGSLEPLLHRHGLIIADVEMPAVNGGSARFYAVHARFSRRQSSAGGNRVRAMRAAENLLRLDCAATYQLFRRSARELGERLEVTLHSESLLGRRVGACGASTRGNTLLQFCGFDHERIRMIGERNPGKWGKFTVGSWIPIVSEAGVREATDTLLVLPWHFAAKIEERERSFIAGGGKLLVPLPEPFVIDASGTHAAA